MAGIPYYSIVPCCSSSGTALDFFNFVGGDALPNGTYAYTGPTITNNGLTFTSGYCYAITIEGFILSDYPDAPTVSSFTLAADCSDILCYDCESPILQYYTLNDCCTGEPIEYPFDYELQGVIYLLFNGNCFETACPIDLIGLTITEIVNEAGINLTGCLELTEILESEIPIGAIQYPYESLFQEVVTVLTCQDCVQCSDICYILTDCENLLDPIYTLSSGVSPFVGGVNSIIINGYTNCWTVAVSEDTCDCAINVVVTQNFTNCELCLGYTSYKLTDCNNSANIMYTSTDLSEYVGQVIEQDCPGCWFVEEFNLQPPTNVPIVVSNAFDSCIDCQTVYWILEDCDGIEDPIITTTDLSLYNNQFITLEWCPTICWEVSSTREHNNATIIILKDNYQSCIECQLDILPCQCSTIVNNTLTAIAIPYYDCFNELVYTDLVQPNKRSKKVCLKKWNNIGSDELYFGDCTLGTSRDFICPPVVYPKRTVRPGYNTPTCTIDHYEKIVCSFANAMYSNTLEKRYGITSCCPEDREKWELKYELVEFASLAQDNPLPPPTPPLVVCHSYTIIIMTFENSSFNYINCLNEEVSQNLPAVKGSYQINVCGIAGQTILQPINVNSFIVTETNTICT